MMKRLIAQILALKPFIAIGAVICLLIWALTRPAPKPSDIPQTPQPAKSPAVVEKERRLTRAVAGAMTLKKAMRNPDSFKLASVYLTQNGTACYEYRAQNGFGGMNFEQAVLTIKGDDILTKGMEGFSTLWNRECTKGGGEDIVDYVLLLAK
jgi:hypothetical protein